MPVTTVVDAGTHVVKDLVFRRAGSLRSLLPPETILVKYSLILRMLAENNWKATSTLWAATPLMRRCSGSSSMAIRMRSPSRRKLLLSVGHRGYDRPQTPTV